MRIGELTALTKADIDFEKTIITINRYYQKLNGKDIISSPKTPKSNRVVTIPKLLAGCLQTYLSMMYELKGNDRIFPVSKSSMAKEITRGFKDLEVIPIHSLRA